MRKYRTIQGDMWDSIAKKVYGDESYMNNLLEANPELTDVVIFSAGVEVLIPDISIQKTVIAPPWKR